MPPTLTIVSNRLPVTLRREGFRRSAGGLVSALQGVRFDGYEARWLGWPGRDVPVQRRSDVGKVMRAEHGCVPVFIPDALADDHYEGFSNSSVWPLLHSMPTYFQYRARWWQAYQEVNRLFAESVLDDAREGDVVWVHDYQLMLLPGLLKRVMPGLRVGFFLHTPFPSSEIFRCHPNREALLEGMLGADLVGFHTFGYLRHFRASVLRLLGVESEMTAVRYDAHTCSMGVYPIGINAGRFEQEIRADGFATRRAAAAASYAGKRVVLSVERLDYTKGIVRRLDSIELLLSRMTPAQRDMVRFVFVSVPTRERIDGYRKLRRTVEHRVGRMNGQYGTLNGAPIHFLHQSVAFEELCALYSVADVAVVTPLVDGMNLVAKEYVACQSVGADDGGSERHGGSPGVLVLSEFAGAAQEFPDALIVNPYDVPGVADAIDRALSMPADERLRRMRPMRERVYWHDAAAWAGTFVSDLTSRTPHRQIGVEGLTAEAGRFRDALEGGRRVAMFLDYDGTLREIVRQPSAATPTPDILALLDRMREAPGLDVTVISGRTATDLARFLGDRQGLGLVCEHGAQTRAAGCHDWASCDEHLDLAWKEEVCRILRIYQHSTPGTHIEFKRTGLVWHYRQADLEFGKWKAKQLVDELSIVAANNPIQVRHGRKIVEVASAHVNKGAAVLRMLAGRDYDLVLLAGDDTTDESMFQLAASDRRMITVRIGEGETSAQYRLPTPQAFRSFVLSCLPGTPSTGSVPNRESPGYAASGRT